MRSVLVVSKEQEIFRTIHRSLGRGHTVDNALTKDAALERLRKKRADFVFIDLGVLRESASGDGYKAALEPFWNLYPTIEIIVMSPLEMIREAVMAVKAGASDYITYPINPEEVKHVTETVHESLMVESELDYLRDRFGSLTHWNSFKRKAR